MIPESRISQIEEQLTWLRQHISEQDKIIYSQSIDIEMLKNKIALLKKHFTSESESNLGDDERPPHY